MHKIYIIPMVVLLGFCVATTYADEPVQSLPFIIYKDKSMPTHYVASGYMPAGECVRVDDTWRLDCAEGKSCIQVVYDVGCSQEGQRWAGIYWLNGANNWGEHKGGYNLSGATKLVFWARGETGNEVIAQFKMGGVGASSTYPDSDNAGIGPIHLSRDWTPYSIDLSGKDLSGLPVFEWVNNPIFKHL